ncbi:MAG TPA: hypothetical protein VN841_00460 [Bryobacteraceae bacterium]|nr:hypothetical protein [Bryobacteraceae bacterium]
MQNGLPENQPPEDNPAARHLIWGFATLAVVLAAITLATFEYSQHQRRQMDELAATNQTLNASLTQLQEQLQSVTERLTRRIEAENAAKAAPPPAAEAARTVRRPAAPKQVAEAAPRRDPRVDALQGQLADQQKALASTREDLDRTRGDLGQTRDELNGKIDSSRDELNGNLGRTRDELNGNIAHTHDELVALQKRGEKNYFEFALNKSKTFQKVGPVSLEVRKVDFKHRSYDLSMLVDDFTLQKKNVNLYEPVWINLTDTPEPLQLIVNQIEKDKITGYIVAPKYRKSELDRTASTTTQSQAVQ